MKIEKKRQKKRAEKTFFWEESLHSIAFTEVSDLLFSSFSPAMLMSRRARRVASRWVQAALTTPLAAKATPLAAKAPRQWPTGSAVVLGAATSARLLIRAARRHARCAAGGLGFPPPTRHEKEMVTLLYKCKP